MTAAEDTLSRIVDLEMRLTFQEHNIGELSNALADLRIEHGRLVMVLQRALDELRQRHGDFAAELAGDASAEPPPPHY